ncbi:hypothetical protein PP175_03445 [Aneurinibacillus sp. Ricciae_BoGa-3]|uniref:hypothetical protein n=1 Tax=Aneurinibacillus sp. Ricciae_BoGa-3 TaxID=3022697 RepID=UPI0023413D7A|nr:hypothetical protein [Aneurinibacillus sp. Ricciae_BoGa-3]WCK55059.1 hypothetical protein PP175_03445 [Aneurinibacillus sp. Ricciae_BoGa-3]
MVKKDQLICLMDIPDDIRAKYNSFTFPSATETKKAADYLGVDPSHLYFNPYGLHAPFVYYKSVVLVELPQALTIKDLELSKMKTKIRQTHASLQKFIDRNEWKRLFLFMDHRIVCSVFEELFYQIPDDQKKEVYLAIKNRIGAFPLTNKEIELQMASLPGVQ